MSRASYFKIVALGTHSFYQNKRINVQLLHLPEY